MHVGDPLMDRGVKLGSFVVVEIVHVRNCNELQHGPFWQIGRVIYDDATVLDVGSKRVHLRTIAQHALLFERSRADPDVEFRVSRTASQCGT